MRAVDSVRAGRPRRTPPSLEPSAIPAYASRSLVADRVAFVLALSACAADIALVALRDLDFIAVAALVGTLVSVLIARRFPVAGLILVAATASLASFVSGDAWFVWVSVAALAFCATLRSRNGVYASAGAGLSVYASIALRDGVSLLDPFAFVTLTTVGAAAAAGVAMRAYEESLEVSRRRAFDAMKLRDREVSSRVAEERLRIARDLHDVLGHEIAVVGMQLGAAEVHTPPQLARAHEALAAAHDGVQRILRESQQILGVMRRDGEAPQDVLPGVPDVGGLVESLRAAGQPVHATIDPEALTLGPAESVTAYRVIQEALTNAHRHGSGSAELSVTVEDAVIRIRVENQDSPKKRSDSRGLGLVGMRERIESVGGSLEAQSDGVRFVVNARIPAAGVST